MEVQRLRGTRAMAEYQIMLLRTAPRRATANSEDRNSGEGQGVVGQVPLRNT